MKLMQPLTIMFIEQENGMMLHCQVEMALMQKLNETLKDLFGEYENESVNNFRGLTYQEVKQYHLRKFEILSKPIGEILKNLLEMEEKVLMAKEAFMAAEEAFRTSLFSVCDDIKTVRNKWTTYKSTLKERNCISIAGDTPSNSPKSLDSMREPLSFVNSREYQTSLSGSPFLTEEINAALHAKCMVHVKPLVFDESVVNTSPVTCHKSMKTAQDSTPVIIPEMPHFQSKTLRSLFENSLSENGRGNSKRQIGPITKGEYDSLELGLRSLFTMEDFAQAIDILNEHISEKNQDTNCLSETAVIAALIMKFNMKQCAAMYKTLVHLGRIV
uniref:Spindle and centriole-associated protein 1 n=1 Tax=Syphacia muris TaxID=451379 RepID=A0A0N5B175_9BILA